MDKIAFNIIDILGIKLEPPIKDTIFRLLQFNYTDYYTHRTHMLWIISLIIILSGTFSQKTRDLIGLTMLIMLVLVSFCGFFLTYIYPKYIYLEKSNFVIKGLLLNGLDLLFHHVPLIIHLVLLKKGYWNLEPGLLMTAILINIISLIFFVLFVNPFKMYMPALYYGKNPTQ
jgi:hypothetical protein